MSFDIKEQDLADRLGVAVRVLRDFRTLHLDEEIDYETNPIRYSGEGVAAAKQHFISANPSVPKVEGEASGANPSAVGTIPEIESRSLPTSARDVHRRLSPLKANWISEEPPYGFVRPMVTKLPVNSMLVLCTVGPHRNVRYHVGSNSNYVLGMEIPRDVELSSFNPEALHSYGGPSPRRKGCW